MKFSLFMLLLLSNYQFSMAQKTIIINGKFDKNIHREQVLVYKPIDVYFNAFYQDCVSQGIIDSGDLRISVELLTSGFIRLQCKSLPKTYCFAEPGDTIQFSYQKGEKDAYELVFYGKNAVANNLLANKKLLNNGGTDQLIIQSIITSDKSASIIFSKLEKLLQEHIAPIHDAFKKKQLTKKCYEQIIAETEQRLLFWFSDIAAGYFHKSDAVLQAIKLPHDEMVALARLMNQQYDPFNQRYAATTTVYDNAHKKSELIKLSFVAVKFPIENTWSSYDKQFEQVVNGISLIDYAPEAIQSHFVGNSLLIASVYKAMDDSSYEKVLSAYEKKFPHSPYLPFLQATLIHPPVVSTVEKNGKLSATPFLFFDAFAHRFIDSNVYWIDTLTSINALIKKEFNGHPVFVDFWASWCTPCLAEFRFEPGLHNFLLKNHIKMLYVSLDNGGSKENWKRLISTYQLAGTHYLVNDKVRTDLEKQFQGIPRYMLFGSDGQLLEADALRPSSEQQLYRQIKVILSLP